MAAEIRRCRPLLGTLVEIAIKATPTAIVEAATDSAFEEIGIIHRLMSFHADDSDVTRINRGRAGEAVAVDARTCEVLSLALELNVATGGAFDVRVARHLQRAGLLPSSAPMAATEPTAIGSFELRRECRVRKNSEECTIDLGGIAKGYAVDRAAAVLRSAGISSALINAGGDIAVIGGRPWPVALRDPRNPNRILFETALSEGAVASSAGGFDPVLGSAPVLGSIVDPASGSPAVLFAGASVRARSCMVADALTKVVLLMGEASGDILTSYRASAMTISHEGALSCTPDWPMTGLYAA